MSSEEQRIIVERQEVKRYMIDCMVKVGASPSHAAQLAETLILGDLRGFYTHGLIRLEMYVHEVQQKICLGEGEPVILAEKASTAWVDGKNVLGPVVGNFCMDLAVKKAKETGVGWVACKGSNHYGIAGYYSLRAAEHGLIGMSFTNTSPLALPTRSTKKALGSNPITLAAPAKNGDDFCLDMATTTVLHSRVERAAQTGEPILHGWAADSQGKETMNPADMIPDGGLLHLGGVEETGGYKGYGLGMMVEIFCGILAGAHWGPNVRRWCTTSEVADLGQCFVAIDPHAFAPGFNERLQDMLDTFRALPAADASKPVMVPGDKERKHIKICQESGGIPCSQSQISKANDLARKLGVPQLKVKC